MASNMLHELPYLPADLVLEKIVPYLPTKSSIRVSSLSKHCWDQGLFFSKPVLNFDEYDDIESVNQHKKFINFLEGYLKFCLEKEDEQVVLNRLRLHTTSFEWDDDYNIITKWLERAIQRGVKELDICLGICTDELIFGDEFKKGNIYCVRWPGTFANAKYLTRLSLGHLSIRIRYPEYILPSLKTLCLRHVWLHENSLPFMLSHCPSLEYFSLTSCNFSNTELHIHSCPSLKSLELKYCGWLYFLTVNEVENLQSFKLVSLPPPRSMTCVELHLNVSSNMKNIYIDCVDGFETLHIRGCHELEATIISQSLENLYFQGYMTAKVSIEACPKALIISLDADQFWIDQRFIPDDSPHFPSVIRFLLNFGCCEDIFLEVPCDFKALIFPEAYRKILPSPLPKCSSLQVLMPNPPTKESGDYFDLMDSLHWIAPSASEAICLIKHSNALEDWRLLQL